MTKKFLKNSKNNSAVNESVKLIELYKVLIVVTLFIFSTLASDIAF